MIWIVKWTATDGSQRDLWCECDESAFYAARRMLAAGNTQVRIWHHGNCIWHSDRDG